MSVMTSSAAVAASTIWRSSSSAKSKYQASSIFQRASPSGDDGDSQLVSSSTVSSSFLLTTRSHADYCSAISDFSRLTHGSTALHVQQSSSSLARLSHKYRTFLRIALQTLQDQLRQAAELRTDEAFVNNCRCHACIDLRHLATDVNGSILWIQRHAFVLDQIIASLHVASASLAH